MSAFFATLAVALLLIVLLLSGLMLAAVLKLRFVPPRTEPLADEELPAEVRTLFEPGLAQLQALGFGNPVAQRLYTQRVAGAEVPQHALLLAHAEIGAAACLLQTVLPDRGRHWGIAFVSRTRSGRTLLTRNRASIIGPVPLRDTETQDCWVHDWPSLWQAHRRRMDAMRPDPARWQRLSAADWAVVGAAHDQANFEARVSRGDFVPAGDGSYRVAWRYALPMLWRAWRVVRASSRGMAGDAPAAAAGAAAAPTAVEQQVETFEREAAHRQGGGWSQRAKWLLFFATAAAAAASFGLSMDLAVVPALVAVLLFHELGHFAAMRWAGYRDLKVFFLPFLGAAVSGRHDHPSAAQELIVLFAGPVPGLLLGLAVLAFGLPEGLPLADFWHSCALLAVTINAFNLLPIHPLDGGKIFEILLLGRWPWLAFAGRVLGVAAFAALAMTTENPVGRGVLWALVALMLLGLSHQRDEARLAATLRTRGALGGQARGPALQALFGAMRQVGLSHKPWPNQRLLAEALLPAMTRAPMSRAGRAGGLLVYAFFLLLPVLAVMATLGGALRSRMSTPVPPAQAVQGAAPPSLNTLFVDLQAQVNAEADPARRWTLLTDAFENQVGLLADAAPGELPAAQALLRQAEQLAPAQPDAASAQARLALWQARATADGAERRQRLRAVVARYEDAASAPADKLLLLRTTAEWLGEAEGLEPALRAQAIDRALEQGAALPAYERLPLLEMKAELQLARGEGEAARRETQAAFDSALASPEPGAAVAAAQLRVDVVLALDGPAAALRELDTLLPRLQGPQPGQAYALAGLRRHGMQLAEVAGRSDWQRAQVRLLPPPPSATDGMPWWLRPLVGRQPPGWFELEHRHWQGDAEGAAEVAEAMRQGRNGGAMILPPGGGGPLAAARTRVMVDARSAVARRYGLPVRPAG